MTRAQVMDLARVYSQVPATVLGDTQAYKLFNQEEIRIWGEVARRAPSVLMTSQDLAYPAQADFITPATPMYRLVLLGTKADSGNRYAFFRQLDNIEFAELERQYTVGNAGSQYKFHFNGTNLYLRPMPQSALTLKAYYVPKCTNGTAITDSIFGGNTVLDTFGEYLANRLALKLRMITGRNTATLQVIVDSQDKDFMSQVQKMQDAEPQHVTRTNDYLTNVGASGSYLSDDH